MKILVGYNGGDVGLRALELARDYAKLVGGFVYVISSMQGGTSETQADIDKAARDIEFAKSFLADSGVQFEAKQSVRGLSPGEDLVDFARENDVEHIFLGIKKLSRAQKMLLGSTSRFVILKAHCPVTTVK